MTSKAPTIEVDDVGVWIRDGRGYRAGIEWDEVQPDWASAIQGLGAEDDDDPITLWERRR